MKLNEIAKTIKCCNCGSYIEIDNKQKVAECLYCKTKYSVEDLFCNDSDEVKIERIKAQTIKDIELLRMKREYEKEKKEQQKEELEKFKKSGLCGILIFFIIISYLFCAVSFKDKAILSGICALIMIALNSASWLMWMQIIKEKKKGLKIIFVIIAFILIIPYFDLYNAGKNL